MSPKLLDLYAEGGLTLEQLMAFAGTADHARQEQVWDALCRSHTREPWAIRRLLAEGAVKASDKRAAFVGLAAYEAAGGVVERDLFDEDGGGYLRDAALLARLAEEKLGARPSGSAAEGWLWVEAAADLPYGHLFGLRRLASEAVPLGDEVRPSTTGCRRSTTRSRPSTPRRRTCRRRPTGGSPTSRPGWRRSRPRRRPSIRPRWRGPAPSSASTTTAR